ncbi:hypothetical protein D3C78_760700 [compost metagenome]
MALAVDHGQGAVGQGMGQAGLGDGHGKGAQQCIGQGHRGPAAEAAVEGLERTLDTQAAHQPTGQGPDDQGDDHVHAGQAEYQHDADRGDHCIHGWLTSLRQKKSAHSEAVGGRCQKRHVAADYQRLARPAD